MLELSEIIDVDACVDESEIESSECSDVDSEEENDKIEDEVKKRKPISARISNQLMVLGNKRVIDDLTDDLINITVGSPRSKRPCSIELKAPEENAREIFLYSTASKRNNKPSMEDSVCVREQLHDIDDATMFYVGVFDGHGGRGTSSVLSDTLHEKIRNERSSHMIGHDYSNIGEFLKEVFMDMDLALLKMARNENAGDASHHLDEMSNGEESSGSLKKCNKLKRFKPKLFSLHWKNKKTSTTTAASNTTLVRNNFIQDTTIGDSGSTATIAMIRNNTITIAYVGDSKAVLCRGEKHAMSLTKDHRPDDQDELARIRGSGGMVSSSGRLYHELTLSRAFGSFKHKFHDLIVDDSSNPAMTRESIDRKSQLSNPLSCIPDVITVTIEPTDEFLVIASSGIWSVLSEEQVVNFVSEQVKIGNKVQAANALADFAISQGSIDNVTAAVIFLNENLPFIY